MVCLLAAFLYPGLSSAQAVTLASSVTPSTIFVEIINWALIIVVILGLLLLPLTGIFWFKKNRENHIWIDFFKSGSFWARVGIIVLAFILWIFKITDRLINLVVN